MGPRRRAPGVSIGIGLAKCKSTAHAAAGPLAADYACSMRDRFPVAILGLALCARSAAGQAQLTPADSAILASQPLKRLVLTPSLFRRLSLLAAGLDREVVLCLQGSVSGDTAVVRDFVMPDLLRSTADLVEPQPCVPTTLAVWHNHPWTGPDSSFGVKTPEDLCSLSQPRSEEHTSELQSLAYLVCRLLLEKKKTNEAYNHAHQLREPQELA